jgi:hypothetical protein
MNTESIAMIAAGIGVVVTLIYLGLGFMGISTLKDIRDSLHRRNPRNE